MKTELKAWKCNLKGLNLREYKILRDMCHASKNVYNTALYNIRQHYFQQGEYLRYEANYWLMKDGDDYNYLGNVAQQTMKAADNSFKVFFALLKRVKQGSYPRNAVKIPHYLSKDGLYKIEFNSPRDQMKNIEKGFYRLPMSRYLNTKYDGIKIEIQVPEYLRNKHIRQIHIIPKSNGKYFESVFLFDDEIQESQQLNSTKALAIDPGVNNFATCATSDGDAFIIDGKKIKSINQWYNKENARLSSIKDHQGIKGHTNHQYQLARKRNARIQDFIYCSAKYIVNYCIEHQIGNIVIGYNDGFQNKVQLGKVNNQNFVMLPYGKFKSRLEYLCKLTGIKYQKQEESYTSKASFFDQDEMPIWNVDNPADAEFSGKRVKRGLYQRKNGQVLNSDVNGALNILRKSNVVDLSVLYSRGVVNTPLRIRLS